jgi:hypothetical protein
MMDGLAKAGHTGFARKLQPWLFVPEVPFEPLIYIEHYRAYRAVEECLVEPEDKVSLVEMGI